MLSRRAAQRARNHYQPTCNTSSVVCSSALSCSDNDFVTFTQEPDDGQPPSCSTYTDDIINGCGVGLSSSRSKLVQWVDDVNDGLCSPVLVGKSSAAEKAAVVTTPPPEPILKKIQIVPPPESPQPEYISFNVSNSTKGTTTPQQPPAINKQCEHLVAIEVEDDTTASLSSQSNDDDSDMTDVTTNNNGLSPKIYAYYTTSPAVVAAKAADEEKRKELEVNQNCFTIFGLVIEPIVSGAIFDTKYCGCEPFSNKGEEEEVVISCVPHWCKDNYTENGKIVVEVSDDEVSQENKAATESDAVKASQVDDEVVVFEDGDMMMLNDIQDLKATVASDEPQEDVPSVLERDMMLDELEVQEAIVVKEEDTQEEQEEDDDDDESDTPSIWSVDNIDGEECTGQQVNASPLAAMGAASTIVSSMMSSSPSDEKHDHEDDMMLDVEDGSEATEDPQEEDVTFEDEDMMVNESQEEKDSSQEIDDNSNADMSDSDMYEALLEWE